MIARNYSANGQIPLKGTLKRFNKLKRFNHFKLKSNLFSGRNPSFPMAMVWSLFIVCSLGLRKLMHIDQFRLVVTQIIGSFLFHGNKRVLLSDKTLVLN